MIKISYERRVYESIDDKSLYLRLHLKIEQKIKCGNKSVKNMLVKENDPLQGSKVWKIKQLMRTNHSISP